MKLKEILELCNKELETLKGVKFKNATEFHDLKDNALYEVTRKFGLTTGLWTVTCELGNNIVYKSEVPVFDIKVHFKEDKRYKFELAGKIEIIELVYSKYHSGNMEDYADMEFEQINNLYIRDSLKGAIQGQEEKIQAKLREIEEEKEWLLKYKTELERVQKEIEIPAK